MFIRGNYILFVFSFYTSMSHIFIIFMIRKFCNNISISHNIIRQGDIGIYARNTNQIVNDLIRNNISAVTFVINGFDFTRNRVYKNRGFQTENYGTATVTTGTTAVVVNHGLDVTPQQGQINVLPNSNPAAVWWVSSINSTSFILSIGTPAANDKSFFWNVNTEDN